MYGCETWSLTLKEELRLRMLENWALRRIFGPRGDEVTKEWRKVHKEELDDLYIPPNNFRMIKSRRIPWAGHVARMGERRSVYRVLVGKPDGKRPFGDPDLDGSIILKWIFRKWNVVLRTGSSWFGIGTGRDGGGFL